MKVLSIGFARELLKKTKSDLTDDTYERLLAYSNYLENYYVLSYSLKKDGLLNKKILTDRFIIFGADGFTTVDAFFRLLFKAININRKESKIDILQAQEPLFSGLLVYLISKIFKKPYCVCLYGTDPYDKYYYSQLRVGWIAKYIARFVTKRASGIQVDGNKIKNSLIGNGIPASRVYLKPMIPYNISKFLESKMNEELYDKLSENNQYSPLLLFVGRLVKQKNLEMLISVAEILKHQNVNYKLIIVGDGPEKATLENHVAEKSLGDHINFVGKVPHNEIAKYFATCEIFVLPSNYEGFPRVFMEAAAAGKPIITTDVGGASDVIVNGQGGYIVRKSDCQTFAAALKNLILDKEKRFLFSTQIRNNILPIIRKYSDFSIQIEIWGDILKRNKEENDNRVLV